MFAPSKCGPLKYIPAALTKQKFTVLHISHKAAHVKFKSTKEHIGSNPGGSS